MIRRIHACTHRWSDQLYRAVLDVYYTQPLSELIEAFRKAYYLFISTISVSRVVHSTHVSKLIFLLPPPFPFFLPPSHTRPVTCRLLTIHACSRHTTGVGGRSNDNNFWWQSHVNAWRDQRRRRRKTYKNGWVPLETLHQPKVSSSAYYYY